MGDWEEEGRRVGEERKEEAGEARREVPGGVGVGVPFPPLCFTGRGRLLAGRAQLPGPSLDSVLALPLFHAS